MNTTNNANQPQARQASDSLLDAVIHQAAHTALSPRFIASLCHEIRSSLNGIIGYTEILRSMSLNDNTREIVEALTKGEQTLLDTLNSSLEYIGQELTDTPLHAAWVRTEQAVNDALHMVRALADHKQLLIQAAIDTAVPTYVEVDETRLRQILMNLLSNAVKYTDVGTVSVSVTNSSPDGITFSVQDTGVGLADTARNDLFAPFTRGTDAHSRPGTGLGLTIAHTLIERMGGQLHAESPADGGSRFCFTLHLKSADEPPPLPPQHQPGSILITDDDPLSRRVTAHFASRLHPSAALFTAKNGTEALGTYKQHDLDVILMDVHMPGMDGLQAVRAIRELEPAPLPRTIVIALTGESSADTYQACREAGFDTVLTKPVSERTLSAILQQQLAAHKIPSNETYQEP